LSLVVAPCGSGKSSFITNLIGLFCKGKGTYDQIFIFCKSRKDKSKGLIEIQKNLVKLPALNELKPNEQNLIIFDDFITDIK